VILYKLRLYIIHILICQQWFTKHREAFEKIEAFDIQKKLKIQDSVLSNGCTEIDLPKWESEVHSQVFSRSTAKYVAEVLVFLKEQ